MDHSIKVYWNPVGFWGILEVPHDRQQTSGEAKSFDNSGWLVCVFILLLFCPVNVGDYIQAVLDRNLAENISRVLYPNDNVSDRACLLGGNRAAYFGSTCSVALVKGFNINFASSVQNNLHLNCLDFPSHPSKENKRVQCVEPELVRCPWSVTPWLIGSSVHAFQNRPGHKRLVEALLAFQTEISSTSESLEAPCLASSPNGRVLLALWPLSSVVMDLGADPGANTCLWNLFISLNFFLILH